MIQLLKRQHPRWYRVQVEDMRSGCTLSFPLHARSSCEARIRTLDHYRGAARVDEVRRRSA